MLALFSVILENCRNYLQLEPILQCRSANQFSVRQRFMRTNWANQETIFSPVKFYNYNELDMRIYLPEKVNVR